MSSGHARVHRIAVIPGDGIGIEVIEVALNVLDAAAEASGSYKLDFTTLPWSSTYYKETGDFLPHDFKTTLRKFDAVLFGAVGLPGMLSCSRGPQATDQHLLTLLSKMSLITSHYGVFC